MAAVVIDANVLADFLSSPQGKKRYWSVDGDDALLAQVSLPCSGDQLADVLRRHGGRVRVTVPTGKTAPRAVTFENFEQLGESGQDGSPLFRLAWDTTDAPWVLVEERSIAEDSLAAGT